jgi:hypothetical protein
MVDPAGKQLRQVKTDSRLTLRPLALPEEQPEREIGKADAEDPQR